MNKITSRARLAGCAALIAGVAMLSGCGPAPYNTSTTSEQTTTTTPAPVVSTTTTTTEHDSQRK
jgi:hypothetical protein